MEDTEGGGGAEEEQDDPMVGSPPWVYLIEKLRQAAVHCCEDAGKSTGNTRNVTDTRTHSAHETYDADVRGQH